MLETFIASDWLKPLRKRLRKANEDVQAALDEQAFVFGEPLDIASSYIDQDCRCMIPANDAIGRGAVVDSKVSLFQTVNVLLGQEFAVDGEFGNHAFVIGDSGTGKTALLNMLKMAELGGYWPANFACELLKLGEETLDCIRRIPNRDRTILLLDALDEDPQAIEDAKARLRAVIAHTDGFYRVIITSENRFFMRQIVDPVRAESGLSFDGRIYASVFLLEFDEDHVNDYLEGRFKKQWLGVKGSRLDKEGARAIAKKMGRLKHRPMFLSQIELFAAEEGRIEDEYRVLEIVVLHWLMALSTHVESGEVDMAVTEPLYEVFKYAAGWMMDNELARIPEARLLEWLDEESLTFSLAVLGSENGSLFTRCSRPGLPSYYRFSHSLYQEFAAAQRVLDSSSSEAIIVPPFASDKVVDLIVKGRERDEEHRHKRLVLNKTASGGKGDMRGAMVQGAGLQAGKPFGLGGHPSGPATSRTEGNSFSQASASHTQAIAPTAGMPFVLNVAAGVDIELLWVEPGSFSIGEKRAPLNVEVESGFWLGKYPVTQKQFEAVLGFNPSEFKTGNLELPVEQVTWSNAKEFGQKLCKMFAEQIQGEYEYEFRLPTEIEWEYVCRAGTNAVYSFGNDERRLDEFGWYVKNSDGQTHTVGTKKPNPWGFYDMHGNVWEWCQDFCSDFFKTLIADMQGMEQRSSRAIRGGSWSNQAQPCRTISRNWYNPMDRFHNLGFRLALARKPIPQPES